MVAQIITPAHTDTYNLVCTDLLMHCYCTPKTRLSGVNRHQASWSSQPMACLLC